MTDLDQAVFGHWELWRLTLDNCGSLRHSRSCCLDKAATLIL